eukprot:EG_transcript_19992
MEPCHAYNAAEVHAAYMVAGSLLSGAAYWYLGIPVVRRCYPWPKQLKRFPVIDGILFWVQCLLLAYLFYSRYHMRNLSTLTLPCHLGLLLCTLLLSRWQDHPALWLLFGTFCIPLAGGGLLGIAFRDRDIWSDWEPPFYDEIFYIEHAMVYLVFHYIFLFKFNFRSGPFRVPTNPLRYALLAVTPAWAFLHMALWYPLGLGSGFNLHYTICPFGNIALAWPLPRALWPLAFSTGPTVLGCLYYLGLELPLTLAALQLVLPYRGDDKRAA